MWQYHRLAVSALPAGLAWLWSVWKSSGRNLLFWKDADPVPGTTPRSSWSWAECRHCLGPLPLPAGLHLCSVVSRLSQLRHKYFPFHITAQNFLIEYYFIFGYLTWCWRTIEFIFIPVEKIIEGWCIWILFQISLNSIIRSGKTYLKEQQTILITIYRS